MSSFDSKSFRGLEKLRFMHLAENKIKSIKEYQLKEFDKIDLLPVDAMIIEKSKQEILHENHYQTKEKFQILSSCQIL